MKLKVNFITVAPLMITISATAQLKVGDTMPSLTLKSNANKEINLANLKREIPAN